MHSSNIKRNSIGECQHGHVAGHKFKYLYIVLSAFLFMITKFVLCEHEIYSETKPAENYATYNKTNEHSQDWIGSPESNQIGTIH